MNNIKLSVCIATYNREKYLTESLSKLLDNKNYFKNTFEVVIVDGASTDNTEEVVKTFQNSLNIKYIKLLEKGGIDKDFDICVRNASSEYCWLLPDDDIVSENTIDYIFNKLSLYKETDLLILNSNCWNYNINTQLNKNNLTINEDFYIDNKDFQTELFKITKHYLSYIGAIIIKKDLWFNSNSEKYYGTRFIHLGVISEIPKNSKILITCDPKIKIRLGNAEWTNVSFKVWYHLWPSVITLYSSLKIKDINKLCFRSFKAKLGLFLYHRSLNTLNFKTFKENILNNKKLFDTILSFTLILIPSFLIRLLYHFRYRIENNLVGLYNITDGRFSKNSWKSID
jgi:glycosyltransferase involved in cell wall biosynthesis